MSPYFLNKNRFSRGVTTVWPSNGKILWKTAGLAYDSKQKTCKITYINKKGQRLSTAIAVTVHGKL